MACLVSFYNNRMSVAFYIKSFRTNYTDAILAKIINLKLEFVCFKIHHVTAHWGFPHPVLQGTLHHVEKMSFVSAFFLSVEKEEKTFFAVICDREHTKLKMFKVRHVF